MAIVIRIMINVVLIKYSNLLIIHGFTLATHNTNTINFGISFG